MAQEIKQKINEPIKILASFEPRKIRIHFFSWQERIYRVTSTNLFHIERDGAKRYYHFAVSALGNSYQLVFDPVGLRWQLADLVSLETDDNA